MFSIWKKGFFLILVVLTMTVHAFFYVRTTETKKLRKLLKLKIKFGCKSTNYELFKQIPFFESEK